MTADQKLDAIMAALARIEAKLEAKPAAPAASGVVFPNYGRKKGEPVAGAAERDLRFYAEGCQKSLANPDKARFHAKERALLEAINAELRRQGLAEVGAAQEPDDFGLPSDDFEPPF